MIPSRSTLASTLAAATDEHFRSALIIVCTRGLDGQLHVRRRAAGAATDELGRELERVVAVRRAAPAAGVSQSWLPSRITRSGRTGSAASARRPASRSAADDADRVDLVGLACPTA